jgi:hypothetical protein
MRVVAIMDVMVLLVHSRPDASHEPLRSVIGCWHTTALDGLAAGVGAMLACWMYQAWRM